MSVFSGQKMKAFADLHVEIILPLLLGGDFDECLAPECLHAREESDELIVEYREGSPARDMMTAQVITSPYHLVAVPGRAGEVRFRKLEVKSQK